jgi:glycosyltransferase involved in cell wall biosynthesis
MLKILNLSAPTALAGAERVILNFLQHYDTSSFSVQVALYLNHQRLDNSFTEMLKKQGIVYEKIPIGNTSLIWQVRQTIDLIKQNSIDVLHTHGYRSDCLGLIAASLTGIPIVSTVHGWTSDSFKLRSYEMLDRFCLKRFDYVVCVSNRLYEEFSQLGIPVKRLVYIPNAVSLPIISPCQRDISRKLLGVISEEKIIIAVGRLSPEKGLDTLLTAFSNQFGSDHAVRLILVGDGPEKAALTLLANRLSIAEQVVFSGFIPDVTTYYAAADLFVLSSHTEGFPMALLEAMAWGLPVLTTAVGGIPDIVQDGVNGYLIPPGDEKHLASAMGNILNHNSLSETMGQMARQTVVEKFSIDQWVRTLEKVYSEVKRKPF